MGYIIKMPKLGLEMERGIVLEWHVDVDDTVEEGDAIVEVESEKSIGEVDAREDGAIRRIYVEEGEEVPPGTPIGILAAPGADVSELEAEAESELAAEAPDVAPGETAEVDATAGGATAGGAERTGEAETGTASVEGSGTRTAESERGAADAEDIKASPRARKRADELGVELATVEGTGPMGSITEDDVEAAAESAASADAAAETGAGDATAREDIKASPRARKRADELGVDLTTVEGTGPMESITEDDVEAAADSASETVAETDVEVPSEPADVAGVRWIEPGDPLTDRYHRTTAVAAPAAASALFETMEAVRTAFEERVTMTDVLVVLASAALAENSVLNGTYADATHHVRERQNVALVADSGGDPVSVVVSDAANRSLTDVVEARRTADGGDADAAAVTETERATFTVANAAETDATRRLVNPPSVAALEVDPTGRRAVPNGDDISLRPLVVATLTYDARAVGGNEAAAFLDQFFERAERAPELVLGSYRGRE